MMLNTVPVQVAKTSSALQRQPMHLCVNAELSGYFFRNTEGLTQLLLRLARLGPAATLAVFSGSKKQPGEHKRVIQKISGLL